MRRKKEGHRSVTTFLRQPDILVILIFLGRCKFTENMNKRTTSSAVTTLPLFLGLLIRLFLIFLPEILLLVPYFDVPVRDRGNIGTLRYQVAQPQSLSSPLSDRLISFGCVRFAGHRL